MSKCNVCYFYENDTCTNADSTNYNTSVSWDDACGEGDFDETIAESDDNDNDDE